MRRRDDSLDRRSLILSVAVHVAILVVAVWSSALARPPLEFTAYEIELVSPPATVQAEEETAATEDLVVERPDPTPPEPEEEDPVTVEEEDPEPEPQPQPPEPEPEATPPPEPEEEEAPATTTEEPAEEAEESGEDINVRLEGVRRDYPQYYNNIITQIQRCFRWRQGGSWQTTVYFVIRADGSVTDLRFVTRSGNADFDFEAMGAVDCAGQGRFGPLPEDVPFERLPIQFNFRPQGGGEAPQVATP